VGKEKGWEDEPHLWSVDFNDCEVSFPVSTHQHCIVALLVPVFAFLFIAE
jgi:hypothetical protein